MYRRWVGDVDGPYNWGDLKDLQLVFEAKFNLLHNSFHRIRFISSSAEIEMVVKPVSFN